MVDSNYAGIVYKVRKRFEFYATVEVLEFEVFLNDD